MRLREIRLFMQVATRFGRSEETRHTRHATRIWGKLWRVWIGRIETGFSV
jgi:hypothetical protein